MTHGSLFSGIGGFDLASQWMGWENVFQVEKNKFCQKVLQKNFPDTKRYGDIKQFNGEPYRGAIDVISGGFPCQPYSHAGQRKGKTDDRNLWKEMYRVIREIEPPIIVFENVIGIIDMELPEVLHDLESEGYRVFTFIIPAYSTDSLHKRNRVWGVGFKTHTQHPHPLHNGLHQGEEVHLHRETQFQYQQNSVFEQMVQEGIQQGTDLRVHRATDGIPHRVDRDRTKRIRSLGNAIVPQIAYNIFNTIHDYQTQERKTQV